MDQGFKQPWPCFHSRNFIKKIIYERNNGLTDQIQRPNRYSTTSRRPLPVLPPLTGRGFLFSVLSTFLLGLSIFDDYPFYFLTIQLCSGAFLAHGY